MTHAKEGQRSGPWVYVGSRWEWDRTRWAAFKTAMSDAGRAGKSGGADFARALALTAMSLLTLGCVTVIQPPSVDANRPDAAVVRRACDVFTPCPTGQRCLTNRCEPNAR